MAKIDKVIADRVVDTDSKLSDLYELRAQTVKRLNHIDKQIAELTVAASEATIASVEAADLVSAGVIVSEIVADAPAKINTP